MGGAPRHALTRGVTAALVVGGLAVLSPGSAQAVSTGRPIAVAVAPDGTSYAGFASGGRLLRLTPGGVLDGSVPLDRPDPVTGLAVAADEHVWVDYGDTVSELAPDGELLTHFAHEPSVSCPADRAHDPAHFGGIEVTADAVYVAGRCAATVGVYSHQGELRATLDLPGSGYPRGVAYAKAYKDLPARLYVSVPDSGKVFAYNAANLRSSSTPAEVLEIQQHYGFAKPEPGGLAADGKGQLVVTDVANNALYFYNGPEDYWFYRTLGHPPDPASNRGYLDRPSAIAQGGEDLDGNLWVADTGNGRIQRWDTIGTTGWMTDALPPGDPGAPVNTELPEIVGAPFTGSDLSCSVGAWEGDPASYAVGWLRDGLPISGADDTTYRVSQVDVGTELTCVVVASDADGAASAPASSEVFVIPGPNSPPAVITKPEITGKAKSGSVLHCSNGTWTDATPSSYVRGWMRDGQLLDGTNSADYLVTDNDVFHELSCRVAAVNGHGTGKAAVSDSVEVGEGGGGGGVGVPENTKRPEIVGEAAVGAELYCDPGTWENAPTFTYVWSRDGAAIGGSEKDHYTVLPDDKRTRVTCLVTGTNPAGSDRASSLPVVPTGTVDPGDPGGSGSAKACRGPASVRINGGAKFARKPYVALEVRAPAGATAVTISNSASFKHADTRSLTKSCLYKWTLDKKSARTPKTVRVKFPGAGSAGTVTARIVLDAAPPRLAGVTAHWNRARWAWMLSIRASDKGTGLARVQVGKTKGKTRFLRWGRPVASADSSTLRWVRVFDRAGNSSGWCRVRGF